MQMPTIQNVTEEKLDQKTPINARTNQHPFEFKDEYQLFSSKYHQYSTKHAPFNPSTIQSKLLQNQSIINAKQFPELQPYVQRNEIGYLRYLQKMKSKSNQSPSKDFKYLQIIGNIQKIDHVSLSNCQTPHSNHDSLIIKNPNIKRALHKQFLVMNQKKNQQKLIQYHHSLSASMQMRKNIKILDLNRASPIADNFSSDFCCYNSLSKRRNANAKVNLNNFDISTTNDAAHSSTINFSTPQIQTVQTINNNINNHLKESQAQKQKDYRLRKRAMKSLPPDIQQACLKDLFKLNTTDSESQLQKQRLISHQLQDNNHLLQEKDNQANENETTTKISYKKINNNNNNINNNNLRCKKDKFKVSWTPLLSISKVSISNPLSTNFIKPEMVDSESSIIKENQNSKFQQLLLTKQINYAKKNSNNSQTLGQKQTQLSLINKNISSLYQKKITKLPQFMHIQMNNINNHKVIDSIQERRSTCTELFNDPIQERHSTCAELCNDPIQERRSIYVENFNADVQVVNHESNRAQINDSYSSSQQHGSIQAHNDLLDLEDSGCYQNQNIVIPSDYLPLFAGIRNTHRSLSTKFKIYLSPQICFVNAFGVIIGAQEHGYGFKVKFRSGYKQFLKILSQKYIVILLLQGFSEELYQQAQEKILKCIDIDSIYVIENVKQENLRIANLSQIIQEQDYLKMHQIQGVLLFDSLDTQNDSFDQQHLSLSKHFIKTNIQHKINLHLELQEKKIIRIYCQNLKLKQSAQNWSCDDLLSVVNVIRPNMQLSEVIQAYDDKMSKEQQHYNQLIKFNVLKMNQRVKNQIRTFFVASFKRDCVFNKIQKENMKSQNQNQAMQSNAIVCSPTYGKYSFLYQNLQARLIRMKDKIILESTQCKSQIEKIKQYGSDLIMRNLQLFTQILRSKHFSKESEKTLVKIQNITCSQLEDKFNQKQTDALKKFVFTYEFVAKQLSNSAYIVTSFQN